MSMAPVRLAVAMVRPPQAIVNRGFADLHAEPDEGSERVDQAHYGERFTLLGQEGDWFYAQGADHYFGWMLADVLDEVGPAERRIVGVVAADVRSAPTDAAPVIDRLPVAAPLAIQERSGDWLRISVDGWIAFRDTVDIAQLPNRFPLPSDLLRTAECFLGAPYLWGGTTIDGIDCSGFSQLVYRLNGVGLDRDADQQALEGRAATTPRAGDLLFFGDERVTHVAIATAEREYLHAPMSGGVVERAVLGPDRELRAIRRYLPEDRG
ncbi:MAG TPA: NlpC/P60 family protein [Candidatus Limnocylindria bacterium]|nr:NlpC/P60 family protein [Candidatus Limnocylindria bacterium]